MRNKNNVKDENNENIMKPINDKITDTITSSEKNTIVFTKLF